MEEKDVSDMSLEHARSLPMAETIDIDSLGDDRKAEMLRQVSITHDEYRSLLDAAQPHFRKTERQSPFFTLSELTFFGAMLSEHCSYKSSKVHLKTLPVSGPHVVIPPGEDAGAMHMGLNSDGIGVALVQKCESHNHPSFEKLGKFGDGYQGAMTGIGGDVRDGKCMGATIIAVGDALRFAEPRDEDEGVFIRNNILTVRDGIAGYGNPLGIAHAHGGIEMWHRMQGNVLGNVNMLGVVTEDRIISSALPENLAPGTTIDDYIALYFGKATDMTGVGGVAFASRPLEGEDADRNQSAVQDGDPFLKRVEFEAIDDVLDYLHAKDLTKFCAFQDMGGAGLLCSTSEPPSKSKKDYGITVDGNRVPVNLTRPTTAILGTSETQERWMLMLPESHADTVMDIINRKHELGNISRKAAALPVGRVNDSGDYVFVLDGKRDVDIPVDLLTKGITYNREFRAKVLDFPEPVLENKDNAEWLRSVFIDMLSSPNCSSDLCIYQRYDKQVGNRTVLERGEAPAAILRMDGLDRIGAVSTFHGNTHLGLLDPKTQAAYAILNSAWRMACVGGSLVTIGNNANYGNPEDPEQMWEFVEGQKGVGEACRALKLASDYKQRLVEDRRATPEEADAAHVAVISGNVSFYNVCKENPEQTKPGDSIPPSTIIAGNGWIEDWSGYCDAFLQDDPGSVLYLVGEQRDEALGASALYYELEESLGKRVPSLDYEADNGSMEGLRAAIKEGYVLAADIVEKGGIAMTVGRMCAMSDVGADVDLQDIGEDAVSTLAKMYSEKCGAVVQVSACDVEHFERCIRNNNGTFNYLGKTTREGRISFTDGDLEFGVGLDEAQKAYMREGLCSIIGEVTR